MAKENEYKGEKVTILTKIEDIENNADVFPGTGDVAEVLKDMYKLIKRQQKQINSLENKVKSIDTRERNRHVVFGLRIA